MGKRSARTGKRVQGFKVDEWQEVEGPGGKVLKGWHKSADYHGDEILTAKNGADVTKKYRLRDSHMRFTLFEIPPGHTAQIMNMAVRVYSPEDLEQATQSAMGKAMHLEVSDEQSSVPENGDGPDDGAGPAEV